MNLVFMNSLERKVGEDRVITGQVSICEEQGKWHVLWNEPREDGHIEQQSWFEGDSWEEMMNAFRSQLAEKTKEGFFPMLGSFLDETELPTGKAKILQMLYYYSEVNGDEEIYQKLRLWRREQASKEGKAPFFLASNRVLRMISAFLPHTREELLQIPGFGENKAGIYANGILGITKMSERFTSFPLAWVEHVVDLQEFRQWMQTQKEIKMKDELDKQANKRKLLEGIERGANLNALQAQVTVSRRDLILWVETLEREGYNVDPLIEVELSAVSELEQAAAWTAFEEQGERYLKPVMAKVYKSDEMKGKELDQAYEWLRLLRIRFRRVKGLEAQAS